MLLNYTNVLLTYWLEWCIMVSRYIVISDESVYIIRFIKSNFCSMIINIYL